MLVKVFSAALSGLRAMPVVVEVNSFASKIPMFTLVGLPDNAVRESTTRVRSAIANSQFKLPQMSYTVNFAPADVKKEGSGYDLPLAVGLLAAANLVETTRMEKTLLIGELGLDGSIRPVRGALPIAVKARKEGYENLIVPHDNVREAAVVNQIKVYGAERLTDVVDFLNGKLSLTQTIVNTRAEFYAAQTDNALDFAEVKGQENVKRAFEVAAAGGHNIILIGSPGCGKSMMARRLPSILPGLTLAESLETTEIHSVAGKLGSETSLIAQRPFRSPHHTISDVALIGGGTNFQPGEISLAHNGVLFLDELPEFSRAALETMRQPLEDRQITISRTKYSTTIPCNFMLVASMNPCPCGYHNDPTHHCSCTPGQIQRYMSKISGPLLDRIDLQIEIQAVPFAQLSQMQPGESSATIRERVIRARKIQEERYSSLPVGEGGGKARIHCNAQMTERMLHQFAESDAASLEMLRKAMERFKLSVRAYTRILKVARTIADLEGSEKVQRQHIAEAIGYRSLDRETWGE